jgi:hypothetical protein
MSAILVAFTASEAKAENIAVAGPTVLELRADVRRVSVTGIVNAF